MILFDMDGVIIDSSKLWYRLFNDLRRKNGLPLINKSDYLQKIWGTPMITEKKFFPDLPTDYIEGYYEMGFDKFISEISINPEFYFLINNLPGIKKGVVSNTAQKQVKNILASRGLYSYFDIVVGGRDNLQGKPEPDLINFAISKFRFKPSETIFVGDTKYDIQAGIKAQVVTIGLGVDGGNYFVKSLREILEIIGELR